MSLFAFVNRRARTWFKAAPAGSTRAMIQLIREDRWRHDGEWSKPGFQALVGHRLGTWLRGRSRPVRILLGPLHRLLYVRARNVYGIELPAAAVVGRRLRFSHQSGIVVHPDTRIGDDCVIRQNVSIGAITTARSDAAPTIGNRVEIGAGAAILGRITIGDDARIGPNTVVMTNVPAGASVFVERPRMIHVTRRPAPAAAAAPPMAAPSDPLPAIALRPSERAESPDHAAARLAASTLRPGKSA